MIEHAPAPRRLARAGRLLALVAIVAAGWTILLRSGHGPLAPPDRWSWDGVRLWLAGRDPLAAALAMIRLGAIGACGQVTVTTAAAIAGSALHVPALLRAADLLALPGTRGLVRGLAGLGLTSVSMLQPAAHASGPSPAHGRPTVTMVRVDGEPVTMTRRTTTAPGPGREDVTLSVVPATTPEPSAGPHLGVTGPEPARGPSGTVPATTQQPGVHVVVRGEHLWSIASTTLRSAWGRSPSEIEVDHYWRAVLAANADLRDPDVLYAGQPVALPPVPGQPADQAAHS